MLTPSWSRDLLAKGIRWKIGDDCSIKVFKDAWLPGFNSGRLISKPTDDSDLTDNSLFNEDKEWDFEFLNSRFLPCEISMITELDLSRSGGSDFRYWSFEENGNYTVKSSYSVSSGFFEPPSSKSAISDCSMWKHHWRLNIPPKVRIFGWKIFHGFILVELQLKVHHAPTNGYCWSCRKDWGSIKHTLIFCNSFNPIWKQTHFWPKLSSIRGMSFQDIMLFMLFEQPKRDVELWIVLLWFIWGGLCRFKHDKTAFTPDGILHSACDFIEHFHHAKVAISLLLPHYWRIGADNWSYPPRGSYRLDVDALFNPYLGRFGIGCVVRDCSGKICLALAYPIPRTTSVLEAELMALACGVRECFKKKLEPIHAFSDSHLLVQAINDRDVNSALPKDILQEIFALLDQGILVSVSHVRRSANRVAHGLATFSGTISNAVCWIDSFPHWLSDLAVMDI